MSGAATQKGAAAWSPFAVTSVVPRLPVLHAHVGGPASTFSMASAVFTGTVDFSTTILELVDTDAIMRAAPSQ